MKAQTKVTDLSVRQFDALDRILMTSYDIPAGVTPVCVVFEMSRLNERHISMSAADLAQVLYVLELIESGAVAEATLTDAERPTGGRYPATVLVKNTGAVTATGGGIANSGYAPGNRWEG